MRKLLKVLGFILITFVIIIFVLILVVSFYEPQNSSDHNNSLGTRYHDNNDGTITDTKTDLMWKRCSLGDIWFDGFCIGKATKYSGNDAIKIKHSFAGYNDWRLPTINELDSLVYCSNRREYASCDNESQNPAINLAAFPKIKLSYAKYWTSTPYIEGLDIKTSQMYYIDFYDGNDGWKEKKREMRVLLVRAIK